MVLLIDHDADGFLGPQAHAAWALSKGMLSADQVPFHKEETVYRGQRRQGDIEHVAREIGLDELLPDAPLDLPPLLGRRPRQEGEVGEVSSQSDAGADNDVRFGPCPS